MPPYEMFFLTDVAEPGTPLPWWAILAIGLVGMVWTVAALFVVP